MQGALAAEKEEGITSFFGQYCTGCHGEKKKADLDLRQFGSVSQMVEKREIFERVLRNLQTHEMPPRNKPQPSEKERQSAIAWIEKEVFKCDCTKPDPGRVTIRRLNRTEYNNTIRDLIGVSFQPAKDFPADDVGYGFDNIGDVLSLPPVLFEKYLSAAQKILDTALNTNLPNQFPTKRFPTANLKSTAPGETYGKGGRALNREGAVTLPFESPAQGKYILRLRAFGQQAGGQPPKMEVRVAGKPITAFDVNAVERAPKVYECYLALAKGPIELAAAYTNNYVNPKDPNPNNRDRNLIIEYFELVGPIVPKPLELPESYKRVVISTPGKKNKVECAREIIERFAFRAYRRPVQPGEVQRLVQLFEMADRDGQSFESALKVPLSAVLVSPHFLFRGNVDASDRQLEVDEFSLASRLSYFLWSSMPDDALFDLARAGKLRKNLDAQVMRMMKDPKSRALVDNFAAQWLQLRSLNHSAPDKALFGTFDGKIRADMQRETELFVEHIIREDRPVTDFLNGDYTFVNERLARHYGIKGVSGEDFRRVSVAGTGRAGVLTHGSVLTITSNPTRTSPVKRGKWVLENLLGAPPPPPPPDVPELKEETVLTGSLRQRMEQHRANPSCAQCHERMDPIGFGLENFDAVGRWRVKDGEFPIDPSGRLASGEDFKGPDELIKILASKKQDEFARCLVEKTLTYALGRGLEYYDKCAMDEIVKNMKAGKYKFSSLVLGITKSVPFQKYRGEKEAALTAN